jgi:hypothetical protein
MSETIERPKPKEPDIGRCFSLIGHACKAEYGFNALAGRFMRSCAAHDCPVRAAQGVPLFRKREPLPQPSQGGGSLYNPRAPKKHRR